MSLPLQPASGFAQTGLSPAILTALARLNFLNPTPIQEKAIPVALMHSDVIGIAQTGTGKTLAFALPILNTLASQPGRALILVPTRELALQVEENIRKVTWFLNPPIKTVCLIGGVPQYRQVRDLKHRPRLIIATPGRLQDHLNQGNLDLNDVKILVLDEADRMLDMGFAPQIRQILQSVPEKRQTMLFSATLAPEIAALTHAYLTNPVRVEVAQPGTGSSQVEQELLYVHQPDKFSHLQRLLNESEGTVLVFVRTKHGATKLARQLYTAGYASAEIHSNRSLGQRRHALEGFKSGKFRILVATDVASRGIDVRNIETVVNYDLPDAAEDYVHRIGRTGRAGATGKAISFATPDQRRMVQAIERLMKRSIPVASQSEQPPRELERPQFRPKKHWHHHHHRGGFSKSR